jgi:hypothetical protein
LRWRREKKREEKPVVRLQPVSAGFNTGTKKTLSKKQVDHVLMVKS